MYDYDIIILVFGCDTIARYRKQILKIQDTWGKKAAEYPNIKILFFLGEKEVLKGPNYIHLPGVKDDYHSASYKQWYGLKHIYDNYSPKFVYISGTDTFINIPKLLEKIKEYDFTKKLYIGGHGEHRLIKKKKTYYHDGGAGYLFSNPCLRYIHSKTKNVEEYMKKWENVCEHSDCPEYEWNRGEHLKSACDVSVGYLIAKARPKIETIKLDENFFQCNYVGRCCHRKKIKQENIISCHKMTLANFDKFQQIIEKNNYFLGKCNNIIYNEEDKKYEKK